jgi:hypothetical protein
MTERIDKNDPLRAQLAELRGALATVAPPPADEAALRAAFRAHAARSRAPARRGHSVYWAVAASIALLVAVGALVLAGRDAPPPAVATAAVLPPAAAVATAFQPLLFAPGWAPSAHYSVVRVRIPLSSFAVAQDAIVDGAVEADLLIGEDGLARGIRFPPQDTLGVSATAN